MKTVGMQREEYRASISRSELMLLGIAGSIVLVVAGNLKGSPEILRDAYFLALFAAVAVIAGSRWYTKRQAAKVRHRIGEGKLTDKDLVGQSRFPVVYEDYCHFSLCMSALFLVGFILLGGPWVKVIASSKILAADLVAKNLDSNVLADSLARDWIEITARVVLLVFLVLLCVGKRLVPRATEARSKLLDASFRTNRCFNEYQLYPTCAEVIKGTKKTKTLIKRIWFVLAIEASCISAGVLESAPVSYYATSMTLIVFYAFFLGYGLLANESARRRVKFETKAKRLNRNSYPSVAEMIELVRFNPDMLWQAQAFPALVIVVGFFGTLVDLPEQVDVALPVFLMTFFLVNYVVRWWISPVRRYADA